MPISTVRTFQDVHNNAARPTLTQPTLSYLDLYSGMAMAYIYCARPVPFGARIISAKMRFVSGRANASATYTLRTINQSWSVSKLNWSNRPTSVGAANTGPGAGALASGAILEFDVTADLQAVANNAKAWWGWRLETDATTGNYRRFGSMESAVSARPTLVIEWNMPPKAPTRLAPAANQIVSVAKPILTFDFTDDDGAATMQGFQVQLSSTSAFTSTVYDSGTVASTTPQHDLSATAYGGLAADATVFWRVRVQDAAGDWSGWSAPAQFTRKAKTTPSLTNPGTDGNGNFVTEMTPPVTWTFGGTQTAYQVRITAGDSTGEVLYDSGKIADSQARSHTVNLKTRMTNYRVILYVWDNQNRATTPGDPPYSSTLMLFELRYTTSTAGPTSPAVTSMSPYPWYELTWSRATLPDAWQIVRDGKVIYTSPNVLDPQVGSSTTNFRYVDRGADPRVEHKYRIHAVVNGQASQQADISVTNKPLSTWLFDKSGATAVCFLEATADLTMGEQSDVHEVLGGSFPVVINQSMRGYEGSLTGTLVGLPNVGTAKEQEQRMWDLKSRTTEELLLAYKDKLIPCVIRNVVIAPQTDPEGVYYVVSFELVQTANLPYVRRN